ncbi:hypothetical protein [Streptomyces sp. NPDC094149]|uniref:hypothetical protein n=1 Tax=Streptomyces sp. NPDC094149 TaxID=3155079 RepID=UPI00331FED42
MDAQAWSGGVAFSVIRATPASATDVAAPPSTPTASALLKSTKSRSTVFSAVTGAEEAAVCVYYALFSDHVRSR